MFINNNKSHSKSYIDCSQEHSSIGTNIVLYRHETEFKHRILNLFTSMSEFLPTRLFDSKKIVYELIFRDKKFLQKGM